MARKHLQDWRSRGDTTQRRRGRWKPSQQVSSGLERSRGHVEVKGDPREALGGAWAAPLSSAFGSGEFS